MINLNANLFYLLSLLKLGFTDWNKLKYIQITYLKNLKLICLGKLP